MAFKSLFAPSLCLTVLLPVATSLSIPVPAIGQMASPWQPIARINPQKPYTVRVNNQTGVTIEYASTTNEFPPRRLQPGTSSTVSQLPLPVYLLISPTNPRFNLQYKVSVDQNLVTVNVQQLPESSPGKTTVNIQETGGIFIY